MDSICTQVLDVLDDAITEQQLIGVLIKTLVLIRFINFVFNIKLQIIWS